LYTKTTVSVTTLDKFCEENKVSKIDLLKIDVEGFEYEVLKGSVNTLTKGKIDTIQIERHVDDMRVDRTLEIHELLEALGFYTRVSIKHSFGNFYEDIYLKKGC
jgi:hypothetical protein